MVRGRLTTQVAAILLLTSCFSVSCTEHYRVGEMDGSDVVDVPKAGSGGASSGPRSAGTLPTAGSSTRVESGGSGSTLMGDEGASAGTAGTGGTSAFTGCEIPTQPPATLAPPFAAPEIVWQRLSLWLEGAVTDPPSAMPAATTYEWSGQIALAALHRRQPVPGIRRFVMTTFDLEADSMAATKWTNQLKEGVDPLQLLYASQWDQHRTGIFGEPEWLTRHPRAVSRGVNILRGVLNQAVPPPPANVNTSLNDANLDNLTTREKLEQHRLNPTCNSCHMLIDPLGLSLEHFDAQGEYRDLDADKPVDSSGTYRLEYSGEELEFTSMEELGPQLATSCQSRWSFADLNFKRALLDAELLLEGEDITLSHQADLARVRQAFLRQQDYPTLIQAIAQSSAFLR